MSAFLAMHVLFSASLFALNESCVSLASSLLLNFLIGFLTTFDGSAYLSGSAAVRQTSSLDSLMSFLNGTRDVLSDVHWLD